MNNPIKLSIEDEYFIAIAKEGMHSFMMIGVTTKDGSQLLGRVAKSNLIDPDFDSMLKMTIKGLGKGSLARIVEEPIHGDDESPSLISYKAYSIDYKQTKEFLGLIAEVEKKQLENTIIKQAIINAFKKRNPKSQLSDDEILKRKAISCYVPTKENSKTKEVEFVFDKLNYPKKDLERAELLSLKGNIDYIIENAKQIQVSNTCRTSALNIVEAILGFVTDVSDYFFISLKYQTTLKYQQIDKKKFYVLPPPPTTIKDAKFTDQQIDILNKLYKRMEEIPDLNSDSDETRDKFDALKSTYKDIVGENNLSVTELLNRIELHEKNDTGRLFKKRSPNFFSTFLSLSSSTNRMFNNIKSNLEKERQVEDQSMNQLII